MNTIDRREIILHFGPTHNPSWEIDFPNRVTDMAFWEIYKEHEQPSELPWESFCLRLRLGDFDGRQAVCHQACPNNQGRQIAAVVSL